MALNFAGLGFSFGAQDAGFNKQADKATAAIDGIAKAVKRTDDIARTNKLNLLANSFQMLQLNNIDSQLDRLNESLNNYGSEGTRSIDQVTDATAKMRANFIGSSIEGTRASQMITRSIGIAGATVEESSQAVGDWLSVFDVGEIEGRFGQLFKLQKLGGVNSQQFAAQIANVEKSWKFDVETGQTEQMIDQILAVGGASGQATAALQAMPGVIKSIDEKAAMFRESLTPVQFQQMVVGTTGLASSLKKIGIPMEQGIESATRMFATFAEGRVGLDDLKAGLGGNLEAFKDFGIAGVRLEETMDMMQTDPLKAAAALSSIREELANKSPAAADRFDRVMNKTIGSDIMWMFRNLGSEATTILGETMPKAIAGAEGASARFTKEMMKSGVVQQEILERSQESFKRTMGSIAMEAIPGVRKSVAKNFYAAGKTLREFVDKGGPLGKLTAKLIGVKEQGFMALFGAMGPVIDVFGSMAMSTLPVITAMGAIGIKVGWLGKIVTGPLGLIGKSFSTLGAMAGPAGPVLLAVGAVGALGAAFAMAGTEGGTKFIDRLKGLGTKGAKALLGGLDSIAPELTTKIGSFFGVERPDMRKLFVIPKSGIISEQDRKRLSEKFKIDVPAGGVIDEATRAKILGANEQLREANKKSMDGFVTDTVKAFDFGKVWEATKTKLIAAFESVKASDIAGFVTKGIELVQTGATAIIDGFMAAIAGPSAQGKVMTAGMALESPLSTAFGQMIFNVGKGVWTAMRGMFANAFTGVTDETKTWGQRLSGLVIPGVLGAFAISKVAGPIGKFVGFFRSTKGKMCDASDQISVCSQKSGSMVGEMFTGARKRIASFGTTMKSAALKVWLYSKTMGDGAWKGMQSFGSAVKSGAQSAWNFAKSVGSSMKPALSSMYGFAKNAASASWSFAKSLAGSMKNAVMSTWNFVSMQKFSMKNAASSSWNFAKSIGSSMKTAAVSTLNFAKSAAMSTFGFAKSMAGSMKNAALSSFSFAKSMAGSMKNAAMSTFGFAKSTATSSGSFVKTIVGSMKTAALATWSFAKSAVASSFSFAKSFAGSMKNAAASSFSFAKSAAGSMKNAAMATFNFAKSAAASSFNFAKSMVGSMKTAALATFNFAKSAVASSFSFVKSFALSMKSAALAAWSFGKTMVIAGFQGIVAFGKLAASAVASMIRVAISFAPVVAALAAFGALVGIVFAIGSNVVKAFGDDSLDTMGKIEAVGEGALKDILGFTFGMFGVAREETDMFVDWLGFAIGDAMNSAWVSVSRLGEDIGTWIGDLITDFGFFTKKVVASFWAVGDTVGAIFKNIKDLATGKVTVGQLFEKAGKDRFAAIETEQATVLEGRDTRNTRRSSKRDREDQLAIQHRELTADEAYEKSQKQKAQRAAASAAEANKQRAVPGEVVPVVVKKKKKSSTPVPGETVTAADTAAAGAQSSSLIDTVMGTVKKGAGKLGEMLGLVTPEMPGDSAAGMPEDFKMPKMPKFEEQGFDFAAPEMPEMPTTEMPSPVGAGLTAEVMEPAAVRFAPEELNTLRAQTAAAQAQVTGMQELTSVMRSMQQAIEMLVASNTRRQPAGGGGTRVDVNVRTDIGKIDKKVSQDMAGSGAYAGLR